MSFRATLNAVTYTNRCFIKVHRGTVKCARWECNYPPKAQDFCEKIASLPLPDDLEYKCEYNNIRALSTLSFMNEDARKLESVKYSKNDEQAFFQLRGVVVALAEELQKTTHNFHGGVP